MIELVNAFEFPLVVHKLVLNTYANKYFEVRA